LFSSYRYKARPVFRWIKKREEVCKGKKTEKFADILFAMENEFGVNWAVFTKEIGYNTTHKKISGGHEEEGCFFTFNIDNGHVKKVNSVDDIHNFVVQYVR